MSDQFLAEIRIFPVEKIPKEFLPCDGQLLGISQNTALFSLLNTTYGGNGISNFALPNLSGRAALAAGTGAGLTEYFIGDEGGEPSVLLSEKQIPEHTHLAVANKTPTTGDAPGKVWSTPFDRPLPNFYSSKIETPVKMSEKAVGSQGGGNAHNNLMPYTGFVFCIAITGFFPERG